MYFLLFLNQPLDQFVNEKLVAVGAGIRCRLVATLEEVGINLTDIDHKFK
jgi:uncharacterized UPF0146 family protein